jgi:hypothetical protein
MRNSKKHPLGILSIIAIGFLGIASAASAQDDHVIAIGKVNSNGTLANSANTVSGVVASVRNGAGDYTVTVTAAGAFTGTVSDDYVGEVTVEDNGSDDQVAKIAVTNVTDDVLTFLVHIDDVEDDTDTDLAEPTDDVFFFSVYRFPAAVPAAGLTRYLIAAAKVSATGLFLGGTGVGGIVVASSQLGTGDYEVTLTKAGAFSGAAIDDIVLQLSLNGTGTDDDAIRGEVVSLTDDVITINVHIDDIQDEANDTTAVPQNDTFHLVVYRIGPALGLANSKLLAAMGRVAGATGILTRGAAFEGGAIGSVRTGTGRYTVTITSPGAFAGKEDNQYVIHVAMDAGGSRDEVIEGDISLPDDNTLTLTVIVNDGEQSGGDVGVADDENFYFLIYDAGPHFQPDLRIGRTKNLTQQSGDNIYNAGAVDQKINVGLPITGKKRYFLSLENDGNLIDDIFLKAKRSGNKIKSKYFRLTGGRQNVTAAITSLGHVVDDVPPCKIIKFEVQAKYKNPGKRPKKTLRFLARSGFLATQLDANKATLKPR